MMFRKGIISIIILAVLLLSVGCNTVKIDEDFLCNWMQYLSDDVKIIDVVIPGSHDAGTKGLLMDMATQNSTIGEQLAKGVRYFDLRVKYNLDGKLAIYHGSLQTGVLFESVLNDIKSFIEAYPTEFLILDFQHFEIYPVEDLPILIIDVEAAIASALNPEAYALKKDVNLSTLTMREIRTSGARYIVDWGREEPTTLAKNYIFRREDALYSPYEGDEHREDWTRLLNYFPNYYAVNNNTRFFVLQSQPTGGDLEAFNDLYLADMNSYVDSLATNSELLSKTNIIMRDFTGENPETVTAILKLNLAKGTIKSDKIEMFTLNINN